MNASRFEKRMESVRSLPRGYFNRYREMFDITNKSKKQQRLKYNTEQAISEVNEEILLQKRPTNKLDNIHSELTKPTIDETEKFHLEMNKIFDDVSNDTNSLITSLCSANLNINDLLTNLTNTTDTENSSLNEASSSNKSNSLKSLSSCITGCAEWYQAVPVYNEMYKTGLIGSREVRPQLLSEKSLDGDVEFSDDSYDELELVEIGGVSEGDEHVSKEMPPPKPARTFEHDIYVETKRRNLNSAEIYEEAGLSFGNVFENNVYESLGGKESADMSPVSRMSADTSSASACSQSLARNSNFITSLNQEPKISTSKSKNAISMPNLTLIIDPTKAKSKLTSFKNFGRIFTQLKKSLSRKSINADIIETVEDDSAFADDSISIEEQPVKSVVLRRMHSNKRVYDNLRTKSHMYSDRTDEQLQMSSLFDYFIIVSAGIETGPVSTDHLSSSESKLNTSIQWMFPAKPVNLNDSITNFCFPDSSCQYDLAKKTGHETFQFTLTNLDASRTYGNCIKIFNKKKQPLVFCIVSQVDAFEVYDTILSEAVKLYNTECLEEVKNFIACVYPKALPLRGDRVSLTYGINETRKIILDRNYDRRLLHINLSIILSLPYDLILKIFSSILSEKKIIFLSTKLSLMTRTIQAFETLLYPFSWPHTFIPVLPSHLIDYCDAPTPYIYGVMKTCKNELLRKYKGSDDILIVDLDKQRCVQEEGNETQIIPEKLLRVFRAELNTLIQTGGGRQNNRGKEDESVQSERNISLCMTFLKFFVSTIGSYRKYLTPSTNCLYEGDKFEFNSVDYVECAPTDELKEFLEWFVQTQLFDVFITRKLNPDLIFGRMFDEEVSNYEKTRTRVRQQQPLSKTTLARVRYLSNKKLDNHEVIYKF